MKWYHGLFSYKLQKVDILSSEVFEYDWYIENGCNPNFEDFCEVKDFCDKNPIPYHFVQKIIDEINKKDFNKIELLTPSGRINVDITITMPGSIDCIDLKFKIAG